MSSVDFAPGMRVMIRDEEWIVKQVINNDIGKRSLHCIGISTLVKDKKAVFLEDLDEIQIVDPTKVTLVADDSPNYRKTQLFLENQMEAIGRLLKGANVSNEFRNLLTKTIDYYAKYQNNHVKHDDNINQYEVSFVIELTCILMKQMIEQFGQDIVEIYDDE